MGIGESSSQMGVSWVAFQYRGQLKLCYQLTWNGRRLKEQTRKEIRMVVRPAEQSQRQAQLSKRSSSFAAPLGGTLDRGMVFTAHLDEDRISIRDKAQNLFEVFGDQTVKVKLSVSMGDDFASPRCTKPGQPYKHPDADFLPIPERAPEPRLFAVYGDGDAEELLLTRDAHEIISLAKADEHTTVLEERMGPPMEVCRSHTLLRAASSEPSTVPMRQLDIPPIVAGFQGSSALDTMRLPQGSSEFTAFRQLVEHPATDEAKHKAFIAALAAEKEREDKHRLSHRRGDGGGRGRQNSLTSFEATQKQAKNDKPGGGYAAGGGGA